MITSNFKEEIRAFKEEIRAFNRVIKALKKIRLEPKNRNKGLKHRRKK